MIEQLIKTTTVTALKELYGQDVEEKVISVDQTKKGLDGDLTIVVFPLVRYSKKKPEQTAQELGTYIAGKLTYIERFEVIKGFLNLYIHDSYYLNAFEAAKENPDFGFHKSEDQTPLVIEYSAPNTNKPLHLGHVRNNLLGYSIGEILKANGVNVKKVNLINDRGIHICKSMLAWQRWGENATPESLNLKGDKLVGNYYVRFDQEYKKEVAQLLSEGMEKEEAEKQAPLMLEAQEMLRKWEAGDPDVRKLWETMNQWVYDGFDVTYNRMGIDFDKVYYESETYLPGKELVLKGLEEGILFQKEDGSVWADLEDEGLDQKLLLRADGTSVYITQDFGTAQMRFDDYGPKKMLYVVGNEQDYHFDVLRKILKKLGKPWAEGIQHISYGMVELPQGKMKSREGTVVDADDLMQEMYETAKATKEELQKIDDFSEKEASELYEMVGLGALKYFILKVDPKKKMMFNPQESIDFNGNTGPFIQYTHARIRSILRKASEQGLEQSTDYSVLSKLEPKEKELVKTLLNFPEIVRQAGNNYSPAVIANYIYSLVKEYNQFYQDISILKEEDVNKRGFRILLSELVAQTTKKGMRLLGIELPERM